MARFCWGLAAISGLCPNSAGGDGGIRTLDRALQPYNGLANRRLQPLGHISAVINQTLSAQSQPRQFELAPELTPGGIGPVLDTANAADLPFNGSADKPDHFLSAASAASAAAQSVRLHIWAYVRIVVVEDA